MRENDKKEDHLIETTLHLAPFQTCPLLSQSSSYLREIGYWLVTPFRLKQHYVMHLSKLAQYYPSLANVFREIGKLLHFVYFLGWVALQCC